jgi:hypothetical protein
VVIPEFEARRFEDAAALDFGQPPSPTPSMRATSYNILDWETTGIERASLVLFWMPFSIANEHTPDWLPGFTTRSEVSRELMRCPERLVLGMPDAVYGASHIRYHAHQAKVAVHPTLDETLTAALIALGLNSAQV